MQDGDQTWVFIHSQCVPTHLQPLLVEGGGESRTGSRFSAPSCAGSGLQWPPPCVGDGLDLPKRLYIVFTVADTGHGVGSADPDSRPHGGRSVQAEAVGRSLIRGCSVESHPAPGAERLRIGLPGRIAHHLKIKEPFRGTPDTFTSRRGVAAVSKHFRSSPLSNYRRSQTSRRAVCVRLPSRRTGLPCQKSGCQTILMFRVSSVLALGQDPGGPGDAAPETRALHPPCDLCSEPGAEGWEAGPPPVSPSKTDECNKGTSVPGTEVSPGCSPEYRGPGAGQTASKPSRHCLTPVRTQQGVGPGVNCRPCRGRSLGRGSAQWPEDPPSSCDPPSLCDPPARNDFCYLI